MGQVRAIRGATTVDEDTAAQVTDRTVELLEAMLEANGLTTDDAISVLFTATPDLHAAFPATAARHAGFGDVPLICAQEIDVQGALASCIRIMLHVTTEVPRAAVCHVYLHGAKSLRDDVVS
jgi:chorismate mutase